MNKIPLHGFNNLTKNLSFSLYKLQYLYNKEALREYHHYINHKYCADNLQKLLAHICQAIGGNVLNIAKQDYLPQGASITLMISEEAQPESLVAHLDKSHLCIHTYPEEAPQNDIAIFRADIELSTCGVISPLEVINHIIEEFDADVIDIDYRIRGMTRDKLGNKIFNDGFLNTINDHLSPKLSNKYRVKNYNSIAHNLFHSKFCKESVRLADYLFGCTITDLTDFQQNEITTRIKNEIEQLFTNNI